MARYMIPLVVALSLCFPRTATADPTTLKLAFFSSDRSASYRAAVNPFLEAIAEGGDDLIRVEPHISGTLGRDLSQQPQLVIDGTADIAYVVPGMTRERFPDNAIVEMPGLYRDMREASLVFTRLIAANALRGYEDFFVIGAFVTEPESIHSRTAIASLQDLRGKKLRVNNAAEAAALDKLGAVPVLLPVNRISDALSSGQLDGALVPPSPLSDYGIKRIATYHYMLGTGGAPLLLLMNRKRFDSLPGEAQALIRRGSGECAAERFIATYEAVESEIMRQLRSDPNRRVIDPSQRDLQTAHAAFGSVLQEWVAISRHNDRLLRAAQLEIARLRQSH